MGMRREYGGIQNGIPLGPLTLRLPFIHYRFEWADYIQGLLMCTVCLSIIPVLTNNLGMSFEVALAIPLLVAYCMTFDAGVERMQALIAFEMTFGLFCILLGITGLAKRFISLIPNAVQAAVLLGAGFAAIMLVFKPGEGLKSFDSYPWTIIICIGLAYYLLFSDHFTTVRLRIE